MQESPQQEALLPFMHDFASLPQQDLAPFRMQEAPLLPSWAQHALASFASALLAQQAQFAFWVELGVESAGAAGFEFCAQAAMLRTSRNAIVLNLMNISL